MNLIKPSNCTEFLFLKEFQIVITVKLASLTLVLIDGSKVPKRNRRLASICYD
jgi:hypothetical protein